ncbi:cell division protein FtsL [Bacillus sp. PS06]|uniref:cell division protein FtsL n=1 Tax=Bacillus sp. PS06 TaxID=2764176 RepID=UPI001784F849|nr:cell division protein FtsL [Bacillus sp. PS06]MBD8068397.1 cell division protein FtsL [Bacillus sp. PS06]
MSNLAYKTNQNHEFQPEVTPQTKVAIRKRKKITLGEKILASILVCAMLLGAIQIVSNQVAIYNANIEIQEMDAAIQEQIKMNNDLTVQVQEKSSYERIWAKAQEMGLFLNENNVKVVD